LQENIDFFNFSNTSNLDNDKIDNLKI